MPRIFSSRVIVYLIFLLALDLSVTPFFQIGPVRPLLEYLPVLYAAFHWGWPRTVAIAFLVGLMRDLTGCSLVGTETFSLVTTSFVLDFVVQKIERERPLVRFLTAFLFVFCVSVLASMVLVFLTGFPGLSWYGISVALGTSLYTACLMPLFFHLTSRYFHDRVPLKQFELFK